MMLNFHNPYREAGVFDLVFDRRNFPGEIALLMPKLSTLAPDGPALSGLRVEKSEQWPETLRHEIGELISRLGEFLEHLGKKIEDGRPPKDPRQKQPDGLREQRRRQLEKIDHSHVLVAGPGNHPAMISGVHIEAGGTVTAVFSLKTPDGAQKNDRYRLDVVQHQGKRVLGGSSYVIAIV
jgi:hypothetical protein